MVDFIKKKIVEKLAKFTKDLKPSDISLSFLSGKGHLSNLELNAGFISEALQLPPWIAVSRVVCDTLRAQVPFTNLNTDPVNFYVGQVLIEVSTITKVTASSPEPGSVKLLNKLGGNPSKYGLIEKVIDGMRIEIRSILVFLKDASFHAQLQMSEILIESTSSQWKVVPLNKSRVRNEDEDSVINYKVCSFTSLKIEGWSIAASQSNTHNELRLIVGASKMYIAFKRKVSNSKLMCTRVSVHLGDLIWILTQSQLRAVSRLVQSLMDAAVQTQQLRREEEEQGESDAESIDSFESFSSDKSSRKPTPPGSTQKSQSQEDTKGKTQKKKKKSKTTSLREKAVEERIAHYREGKLHLPSHEVIQNSFHLNTGKVDFQLCDDTAVPDSNSESSSSSGLQEGSPRGSVQGSMLIEVTELTIDVYLDQPACVGRAHWNKANEILEQSTSWSNKLVTTASKTQFVDVPSVSVGHLRERSVVIRCSDFTVGALRSSIKDRRSKSISETLPIITSDKRTFNIPDDLHNPAFQVGVSLYFYPDKHGNKFLVPRPNIHIHMSPVHANIDQKSCLWLVEFVHGVVKTINVELALNVKDEGKSFLEEIKAKSDAAEVTQLPGVDIMFKILFTKVTLPLPDAADDGRPKALQIETSAIEVKNCPLNDLLGDDNFSKALQALKDCWILSSQDTSQFPHYQDDLRALPTRLQELLQQTIRTGRKRGESFSSSSPSHDRCSSALAPEETLSEMVSIEGWHISTSCVHVAFASNYTHQATLNTKTFISDFPLHFWLFLPPSSLDTSIPSLSSPPTNQDPRFAIIGHAPSEICVELERLQLLFLMRLKDSFTAFKDSLMRFLDPDTFAPNLKETLEAHRHTSKDADDIESSSSPITISGYVMLRHVKASILLPTLTSTNKTLQMIDSERVVSPDQTTTSPSPKTTSLEQSSPLNGSPEDMNCTIRPPQPLAPSPQTSSPNNSLANIPKVHRSHSPGTYASTSNLPSSTTHLPLPVSNSGPPSRTHSAVELLPSHLIPVLDFSSQSDEERKTGPKHRNTAEGEEENDSKEDFVMVESSQLEINGPQPGNIFLLEETTSYPSGAVPRCPSTSSISSSLLSTDPLHRARPPRRQKSPVPLKAVPQFVLHAEVKHIFAIPNIKAGEISVRLSADTVGLRELGTQEYQGMKELFDRRKPPSDIGPPNSSPSIKARMEVGKQVARFYPGNSVEQDIIVIAKVEGLDLSLLMPNIAIMKDFFDDEYEAILPLPLHLKVATTRAVLVEDLTHSADHVQSMSMAVEQLEIHRGRELVQGADVFMEAGGITVPQRSSTSSHEDDDQLLKSFTDFISTFESHVQQHGHVHLPHPQRVATLLEELHSSLLPVTCNHSPPPTYTEVVTPPFSFLQSSARKSSSELLHLRRENEQLRQVQRDCEKLSALLKQTQVAMDKKQTDFLMVTEECKKTKEELVSYKQVMEKQHEHIEKLLTENFELQRQCAVSPFGP